MSGLCLVPPLSRRRRPHFLQTAMTDPSLGAASAWSNISLREGGTGGGGKRIVSGGGSIGDSIVGASATAGETRQGHGGPGTAAAAAAAVSPSSKY